MWPGGPGPTRGGLPRAPQEDLGDLPRFSSPSPCCFQSEASLGQTEGTSSLVCHLARPAVQCLPTLPPRGRPWPHMPTHQGQRSRITSHRSRCSALLQERQAWPRQGGQSASRAVQGPGSGSTRSRAWGGDPESPDCWGLCRQGEPGGQGWAAGHSGCPRAGAAQ